jgi:hypothetical protein
LLRARSARPRDGLLAVDGLPPALALLALLGFAALLLWGLAAGLAHHGPSWRDGGDDGRLYESLIAHVKDGVSYYSAAPEELRRRGFPVRPFVSVRPPLLTLALAQLPGEAARYAALAALAIAAWLAWSRHLWSAYRQQPLRCAWALAVLSSGVALALSPGAYLFHESWAGLLIALSLALWGPRTWALSLALGLLAALIRELAFPYLAVMALFAWREGRRGETAAWLAALGVALAALAGHAVMVTAVTHPTDPASPGWMGVGGYPRLVHLAQLNSALLQAPLGAAALVLPCALLGLLFWRGGGAGRAPRCAFTVLGYSLAFCIVARPDNDYWGLMTAPLWPLGLCEADRALKGLLARTLTLRRTAFALRTRGR